MSSEKPYRGSPDGSVSSRSMSPEDKLERFAIVLGGAGLDPREKLDENRRLQIEQAKREIRLLTTRDIHLEVEVERLKPVLEKLNSSLHGQEETLGSMGRYRGQSAHKERISGLEAEVAETRGSKHVTERSIRDYEKEREGIKPKIQVLSDKIKSLEAMLKGKPLMPGFFDADH